MRVVHQAVDTQHDALDSLRKQAEAVLGKNASRVNAFYDGSLYVDARARAAFGAWLVDCLLVAGLAAAGAYSYYRARMFEADAATGASVIGLVLLVVLPLLYGFFYRDGRGLGALLTGTRLVRIRDGGPIGLGQAGLAMLIRTLLFPILLFGVLDGSSGVVAEVRVSIDAQATERLRAAGFTRLG